MKISIYSNLGSQFYLLKLRLELKILSKVNDNFVIIENIIY